MSLPQTMRAAVITAPGGPDVLVLSKRAIPHPGSGEILVRVRSSALNRADLHQRAGRYNPPPGVPQDIPGLEFAGRWPGWAPVCRCGLVAIALPVWLAAAHTRSTS